MRQTIEEIRIVRRLAEQRRRDIRRMNGRCGHCGEPSPDRYSCQVCIDAMKARQALRRSAKPAVQQKRAA